MWRWGEFVEDKNQFCESYMNCIFKPSYILRQVGSIPLDQSIHQTNEASLSIFLKWGVPCDKDTQTYRRKP